MHIIINAYYNYIFNAQRNYYISNKGLLEECDKEENVDVAGAATTSCLKTGLQYVLTNVMYSPSHRQADSPKKNIQSKIRIAPDLPIIWVQR